MATDVKLERIERQTALVEIKGTAPLIVHAWSQKARQEILAKHMGSKPRKALKDPQADFMASRYLFADGSGDGFPTGGFKKAVVMGGGRIFGKAVKMTELRQNLLFLPDGFDQSGTQLTRIMGEPVIRQDMVRNATTVDIRHRAMFEDWGAVLQVQFIDSLIDLSSIVALIDAGGTNGIGDWRPEKNGSFGTFEVVGA